MEPYAERGESIEGKDLIMVRWQRDTPDAAAPMLEAIFEGWIPQGVFILNDDESPTPAVLQLLSVTRVDTREAVLMTPEEREAIGVSAAEKLASVTKR